MGFSKVIVEGDRMIDGAQKARRGADVDADVEDDG